MFMYKYKLKGNRTFEKSTFYPKVLRCRCVQSCDFCDHWSQKSIQIPRSQASAGITYATVPSTKCAHTRTHAHRNTHKSCWGEQSHIADVVTVAYSPYKEA